MPCKKGRKHTPITKSRQARAMGIAYSAKKGETPVSKLRGPAKKIYESMSGAELKRHLLEWGHRKNKKSKKRI